MTPIVRAKLAELVSGDEQPRMVDVLHELAMFCRNNGEKLPSRAAVYKAIETLPTPAFQVSLLPSHVQEALYNVSSEAAVPGHQLVFYCLNYGGTRALSFAAGLPWLALYQAARQRGWRAKSRGLLSAIMATRRACNDTRQGSS